MFIYFLFVSFKLALHSPHAGHIQSRVLFNEHSVKLSAVSTPKKGKVWVIAENGFSIMPLTFFRLNRVKLQGEISHLKLMTHVIQKGHANEKIKFGHFFVSRVGSAAKRPFLLVVILLR